MLFAVVAARPRWLSALAIIAVLAIASLFVVHTASRLRDPAGIGCAFGWDYLHRYVGGKVLIEGRGEDLYDQGALQRLQGQLFTSPVSQCAGADFPVPYFAFFLLPTLALSLLSPVASFLAFYATTVVIFLFSLRRLARLLALPVWVLWLVALGFAPIYMGLWEGQVHGWLFLGATEFFIATRQRQDIRAGLWLGLLVAKYQFLPLFILLLVFQRRWRALSAFIVAGLAIISTSLLLVGRKGLDDYLTYILGQFGPVGGYLSSPWWMANWRGLVLSWLPVDNAWISLTFVVLLSILTLAVTMRIITRSIIASTVEHQHLLFLSLASASLLIGYDTQVHSTAFALSPALMVVSDFAKRAEKTNRMARWLLDLLVLVPSILYLIGLYYFRDPGVGLTWASPAVTVALIVAIIWIGTQARSWTPDKEAS